MSMPHPESAMEVDDGLIIDGVAGIFVGNEGNPDYEVDNGSIHLTPTGIWQRRSDEWVLVSGS